MMRPPTPTRVRTPVRSSSIGSRPSPSVSVAASPRTPVPTSTNSTIRNPSPRAAIANSPISRTSTRALSPTVRSSAPPPPMTTSSLRNGASPASRNTSPSVPVRMVSPASRTVSPLKPAATTTNHASSYGYGGVGSSSPTVRGGVMNTPRSGIVSSPRTSISLRQTTAISTSTALVESPAVRGGVRRTSASGLVHSESPRYPSPNHARETSSMQKAQLKKDNEMMQARVNQLMAVPKPNALVASNYFRLDLTREEDLRTAHLERIMVDPENCGSKRVIRRTTALTTHMAGILGSSAPSTPRSRSEQGDYSYKGKTHFTASSSKSTDLIIGSRKTAADEEHASTRRETESARRLRATSASDTAPWLKGPAVNAPTSQRAHSAQRAVRTQSPISFDPYAPITPRTTRMVSITHRHHDVFTDKMGADGRGIAVAATRIARTKTAETIRKEMAAAPPPELPPRKKPSIKPSPNSAVVNDIFATPYGDAKACDLKYSAGKRIISKMATSTSDPNAMNERSYDNVPAKGKRHVSPVAGVPGAAGLRSVSPLSSSPDATRRRANVNRNVSNLSVGDGGLLSTAREGSLSPSRRHVLSRPSTAVNAPFGTDINEWAGASRHALTATTSTLNESRNQVNSVHASPVRYASPADRARGSRSPGFFNKPSSNMKSVFSWDS